METNRVVYNVKDGKYNYPALQISLVSIAVWYFYHTANFHYGLLFTGSQSNNTDIVRNEAEGFYHYSALYVIALPVAAALATDRRSAKTMLNYSIGCNALMHVVWVICDSKELDDKFPVDDARFWRGLWHALFGLCNAPVLPCVYILLGRIVPDNFRATFGSLVLNVRWIGMLTAFFVVFVDETAGPSYSMYGYYAIYLFILVWILAYWLLGSNYDIEYSDPVNTTLPTAPRIPWRSILKSPPVIALIICHSAYYFTHMLGLHSKELILLGTGRGATNARPTMTAALWSLLIGTTSGALSDVLVDLGFVTTTWARKLFNFVGAFAPMTVAAIYFKIVQHRGATDYDASWQYLSVIVAALSSLQTSGFLINHMDLSPYYAGVLIAVTEAANHVVTVFTIIAMNHWDVNVYRDYVNLWLSNEGYLNWIFIGIFCFWSSVIFMFFGQTSIQKWSPIPMSYRNKNMFRRDV